MAPATPAPPAEQTEHLTIEAEVLFRFAGGAWSDLQPRGLTLLDDLASHLHESYSSIRLIELSGYTDRLGSRAYNLSLSSERADTVRAYLIARGVGATIEAHGKGSEDPVSRCSTKLRGAPLHACLKPDRRVEIVRVRACAADRAPAARSAAPRVRGTDRCSCVRGTVCHSRQIS